MGKSTSRPYLTNADIVRIQDAARRQIEEHQKRAWRNPLFERLSAQSKKK